LDKNRLKSVILALIKEDGSLEAKISKIISELPPAPTTTTTTTTTQQTPSKTPISTKSRTISIGSAATKKPSSPASGSASPTVHLSPAVKSGRYQSTTKRIQTTGTVDVRKRVRVWKNGSVERPAVVLLPVNASGNDMTEVINVCCL